MFQKVATKIKFGLQRSAKAPFLIVRAKDPFTRFCLSLFAIYLLVFSCSAFITIYLSHKSLRSVAVVATEMVRNNLLNHDYREPIIRLQNLADRHFSEVTFVDHDGSRPFILRPSRQQTKFLAQRFSVFLEDGSNERIEFSYSLMPSILGALTAFGAILILSIFPALRFGKRNQLEIAQAVQRKQKETLLNLATQVSHDIRSPVSALNMCLTKFNGDEEAKEVAKLAIKRINDIAQSLLKQNSSTEVEAGTSSQWRIKEAIENIVREKQAEIASVERVKLSSYVEVPANVLAKGTEAEVLRVISNLINNSVESFGQSAGIVQVSAAHMSKRVEVIVEDNGPGIPETLMQTLGHLRSSTKSDGNGLGIFNGKRSIEALGGRFRIESRIGKGTKVILDLPTVG